MKRTVLVALILTLLLSACTSAALKGTASTAQGSITTTTEYNNAGHKIVSEFDENNTLLTKTRFTDDGHIIFEYDSHENVVKKSDYDMNGDLEAYTEYTYDQQDREISCITFDKNGSQARKYLTEYDEDGTKTIYSYDANDESEGSTVFKYNENGDVIEHLEYLADGTLNTREVYEYNQDGNETATFTYNGDGSLSFRTETTYDENGNFLDYVTYDSEGNVMN